MFLLFDYVIQDIYSQHIILKIGNKMEKQLVLANLYHFLPDFKKLLCKLHNKSKGISTMKKFTKSGIDIDFLSNIWYNT